MGLFGSGRNIKMSDYFSVEELTAITEKAQAARSGGAMLDLLGKGLIDYISNPDKEMSDGRFKKFIKVAESFKSIDPSLYSMLLKGIEKFRADGK